MSQLSDAELWHQKLGHINYKTLQNLGKKEAVRGLPKSNTKIVPVCETCQKGKQTRASHPNIQSLQTSYCFELLHMDLMGPLDVETIGGKRQVGGSQEMRSGCHNNPDFQENRTGNLQMRLYESKLNPEAKTFSPSMLQHRTVTSPEEIDASSFPCSYVPGVGYYQRGYIPNPQNVMFGRGGPHASMHPIPNDLQPAVLLYPATPQPLLTPHQVHHLYQGNASAAQALHLHMTQSVTANRPPPYMANIPPHVMANIPQQFVMPNHIPVSQPVFPVLRQNANPGFRPFQSA
ncbi:hypothetical protein CASFOL_025187 [Castilleja foliolosa]|uniref:GAG-pre-integrase domain-containing protein n=1 Tax=Castilleja foliolosa TaxID=1961234 RepID=A0ABD3CQG0_9LAMI